MNNKSDKESKGRSGAGKAGDNKKQPKRREKKLTAAERRRIEREKKRELAGDDPLSAFDTPSDDIADGGRRTEQRPRPDRPPRARIKPASKLTAAQRRRRVILSYAGVFIVIVVLAITLSLTVLFRTTDIRVEGGEVPYEAEEIIKTSGLSYNKSIFLSKKKAARKNLVETYPYIEDASVSVRIPSTQIIHISAAVPSYQVQFSGGYAVVSENSRILEVNDKPKSGIPILKGLRLHETAPGEYITFEKSSTKQILDEVVKNINDNNVENIYGIDISNTANIQLNYDNRITILLGLPEDVGYKLRTAKAIISQSLNVTDKGTLDVSLANSDRRSSYFTPIYSDTASLPQESTSSVPAQTEYLDDIITD